MKKGKFKERVKDEKGNIEKEKWEYGNEEGKGKWKERV